MRIHLVLSLLVAISFSACGSDSGSESTGGSGGSAGEGGSGGETGGTGGSGGTGGTGGSGGAGGSGGWNEDEVCRIWNEGHVENEKAPWIAGEGACDPGTFSDVAAEDTLRRINMYRELAGLPPVTEDHGQRDQDQACAVVMNANNALSHTPPSNWNCWSQAAYDGANSSNLALGYRTPGSAIDGLMGDAGVRSQGHRRWLLGFYLGKVGLGFAGRATCVGVFDDSNPTDVAWTAYPPAGAAPIGMVTGREPIAWSFHPADGIAGAEVTMQRLPKLEDVAIDTWIPDTGFRIPDAIAWQPPTVRPGQSYRITITRPAKETITYDVKLVDCDA